MIETHTNIEEVVSIIRSGKQGRDQIITSLFKDAMLRQSIRAVVLKYGGREEDVSHIFNTTLMQFVKTVMKNPNPSISSGLHTYLCGIAKYSWFHETKRRGKNLAEDIEDHRELSDGISPENLMIDQSKFSLLHGLLDRLGKNCKEVLLHWANGFSMVEIAKMMNYKSDMMARKKKYKCFKELMEYMRLHPEIKEALI